MIISLLIELIRLVQWDRIHINSLSFFITTKLTGGLLILCAQVYLGYLNIFGSISCFNNHHDTKTVSLFCSPFVQLDALNRTTGTDVVYPGVGNGSMDDTNKSVFTHFMFLYFVLLFQGACFLAPYHTWKFYEGGFVAMMFEVPERKINQIVYSYKNVKKKLHELLLLYSSF